MDMKTVAVLAITLWTISSPVLAALRSGDCSGQATDWCADATNGDANSVCEGTACVCSSAFKLDTDCVAKLVEDDCTQDTDCAGATDAVCTDDVCACPSLYTANAGKDVCNKVLGDDCTGTTKCDVLDNAVCDTDCKCKPGYRPTTAATNCEQVLEGTCAADAECTVNSNTNFECSSDKCACKDTYAASDKVCVLEVTSTACTSNTQCTATNSECDTATSKCKCKSGYTMNADECKVKNGANGMVSSIGLVCAVFVVAKYLLKY